MRSYICSPCRPPCATAPPSSPETPRFQCESTKKRPGSLSAQRMGPQRGGRRDSRLDLPPKTRPIDERVVKRTRARAANGFGTVSLTSADGSPPASASARRSRPPAQPPRRPQRPAHARRRPAPAGSVAAFRASREHARSNASTEAKNDAPEAYCSFDRAQCASLASSTSGPHASHASRASSSSSSGASPGMMRSARVVRARA